MKPELTSMLPCVDLLRRAIEPPEENERYKREGFYDDEPYMEDRAA